MPPTKLLILIILLSCTPRPSAQDATPLDLSPLSADQISIYNAFLASYTVGGRHRLNLINQTYPLRPKDLSADCLQGTGVALGPANSAAHHLDSQALAGSNITLIDPTPLETGLRLSEVAFDPSHRYAVMSYRYHCGSLCGHGSTVVYEKKDGKWQPTKRKCPAWIS